MSLQNKTLNLIKAAATVLEDYHPMTLRQVFYQLVSRHVIENTKSQYQRLSNALVKARQEGMIPFEWMEDRVRRPRVVSMWQDLPDFLETVCHAYRRDVWGDQSRYVEVWLEKDALSGVFEDITHEYGVTLVVCRGYNSWSAYKGAANRISEQKKPAVILYFGDFDPSGEDIVRALKEGLAFFGTSSEIKKVALTRQDVIDYHLPPDFTKKTDTRAKRFVEKHGDIAVELDALPMPVLQRKVREAIEAHLDLESLSKVWEIEEQERQSLQSMLA